MLREFVTVDKLQKPLPDIQLCEVRSAVGPYASATYVKDPAWIPQGNEAYSLTLIECERKEQMQCIEIIVVVLQVDTLSQTDAIKLCLQPGWCSPIGPRIHLVALHDLS